MGGASACDVEQGRPTAILDRAVAASLLSRTKGLTAALQQGWREGEARARADRSRCPNLSGAVDILDDAFARAAPG